METNNYPVGLLGGHPEVLHCVGEKELQRKKSLIQTTLEEEEISGSNAAIMDEGYDNLNAPNVLSLTVSAD